ncbi:hypothetical protein ACTHO5_19035 [Cytobacillus praedii]
MCKQDCQNMCKNDCKTKENTKDNSDENIIKETKPMLPHQYDPFFPYRYRYHITREPWLFPHFFR